MGSERDATALTLPLAASTGAGAPHTLTPPWLAALLTMASSLHHRNVPRHLSPPLPRPACAAAAGQRRVASPARAAASEPPPFLPPGQPVSVTALASILQRATRAGGLESEKGGANLGGGHAATSALASPGPSSASASPLPSTVYLVGTGPGDPGLLTLAALQLMATAGVVLVDRLVSPDVLALVRPGAVVVDVGKEAGLHTLAQPAIAAALITAAREQEKRGVEGGSAGPILRLKGGDPFIFGRGGEEAAALRAAGVSVVVVPGVTAAAGVCASLGIPATHRGLATSVRYLTGHALEGGEPGLDDTVARAADPDTTLVVYMGLATLRALATRLMGGDEAEGEMAGPRWAGAGARGLCASTPAVAVERGTTPAQRAVYAPLGSLADAVASASLSSPTLIIIGRVVALSPGWAAARGEAAWEGVAAAAEAAVAEATGGVGDLVAL